MTPRRPLSADEVTHSKENCRNFVRNWRNATYYSGGDGDEDCLVKEDQIPQSTQHQHRRDQPGQAFRIEERRGRSRKERGPTMPAAMIDDREGITASGAIFQRHNPLIAGFAAIARTVCAASLGEIAPKEINQV